MSSVLNGYKSVQDDLFAPLVYFITTTTTAIAEQ